MNARKTDYTHTIPFVRPLYGRMEYAPDHVMKGLPSRQQSQDVQDAAHTIRRSCDEGQVFLGVSSVLSSTGSTVIAMKSNDTYTGVQCDTTLCRMN